MPKQTRQLPFSAQSKLPPRKPRNLDVRQREYLTESELDAIRNAAKATGRYGHRDATLIDLAYRHGLRVSELVDLRWDQFDLDRGTMHVNRLKNGNPSIQTMIGAELRSIRQLKRDWPTSPFVFCSERGGPLTPRAVYKIVARAGELAGLHFRVHPHMLRHSTGHQLASNGIDARAIQDYLGHRNIQHSVRYTQLAPNRLKQLARFL